MNVVLICTDTLRWDYLGCYGSDCIETPNLDALAKHSALFLDAYAEGLPTIPVRRVLMTGRNIFPFDYRPQKSDMVQIHGWHPLFDEDVTLAEHLQSRGYHTAFFNDVYHLMKPGKNFHRGFDQWFWIRGQEADPFALPDPDRVRDLMHRCGRAIPDNSWVVRHLVNRQAWESDADTLVAQTMSQAADWVRSYALAKPFYLHVEVFDPHEPWDPPSHYAELYESNYGESLAGVAPWHRVADMSAEEFRKVWAAYAGEVTLVDRWVGHLLEALEKTGRLHDTLVVFTSDHGCMMGEQGEVHKGYDRLRNQVTRVPLLMRHPLAEAAGARVPGFCQHQDIVPTILSVLGEPIPARVTGRNLWPQALGGTDGVPNAVVSAFGEYAAIRTADWNYIRPWTRSSKPGVVRREQLYDLKADPAELQNVAPQHPEVRAQLAQRLEEHIRKFAPLTAGSFQGTASGEPHVSFDALPPV